ncbi:MAG TPA: hypothetical protein VIH26_03950 [Anaerolineales bacterium]
MQLRCYRCGWSFAINKDEIAFALAALEGSQGNHYDVRCPRCRHSNRVALEQLRRAVPRPAEPASAPVEEQSPNEGSKEDPPASKP